MSTTLELRCWLPEETLTKGMVDYTSINLTKRMFFGLRICQGAYADSGSSVDVLDSFPEIRVAVAYITPDGNKMTSFPADLSVVSDFS